MENNTEKKTPWAKIAKLFAEFVIAAITALCASSFVAPDNLRSNVLQICGIVTNL